MMSPTQLSTESVIENSTTTIPTTPTKATIVVDSTRDGADHNSSKSQCSSLSDGENYEFNGEGVDLDGDLGIIANDKSGR